MALTRNELIGEIGGLLDEQDAVVPVAQKPVAAIPTPIPNIEAEAQPESSNMEPTAPEGLPAEEVPAPQDQDAAVPAKPQEPQRPAVAPVVAPVAPDRPYDKRDMGTWTDAQLEAHFANEDNLDFHTGDGERALVHARARLQEIDERLTQGEASVRSGRMFSGLFGDDTSDYEKLASVSVRQIGAILDPYALRYLDIGRKSEIVIAASDLLTKMETAQKRLKGNPVIAAFYDPWANLSNILYDAVGLKTRAPIVTPEDAYVDDGITGALVMLIPIFKGIGVANSAYSATRMSARLAAGGKGAQMLNGLVKAVGMSAAGEAVVAGLSRDQGNLVNLLEAVGVPTGIAGELASNPNDSRWENLGKGIAADLVTGGAVGGVIGGVVGAVRGTKALVAATPAAIDALRRVAKINAIAVTEANKWAATIKKVGDANLPKAADAASAAPIPKQLPRSRHEARLAARAEQAEAVARKNAKYADLAEPHQADRLGLGETLSPEAIGGGEAYAREQFRQGEMLRGLETIAADRAAVSAETRSGSVGTIPRDGAQRLAVADNASTQTTDAVIAPPAAANVAPIAAAAANAPSTAKSTARKPHNPAFLAGLLERRDLFIAAEKKAREAYDPASKRLAEELEAQQKLSIKIDDREASSEEFRKFEHNANTIGFLERTVRDLESQIEVASNNLTATNKQIAEIQVSAADAAAAGAESSVVLASPDMVAPSATPRAFNEVPAEALATLQGMASKIGTTTSYDAVTQKAMAPVRHRYIDKQEVEKLYRAAGMEPDSKALDWLQIERPTPRDLADQEAIAGTVMSKSHDVAGKKMNEALNAAIDPRGFSKDGVRELLEAVGLVAKGADINWGAVATIARSPGWMGERRMALKLYLEHAGKLTSNSSHVVDALVKASDAGRVADVAAIQAEVTDGVAKLSEQQAVDILAVRRANSAALEAAASESRKLDSMTVAADVRAEMGAANRADVAPEAVAEGVGASADNIGVQVAVGNYVRTGDPVPLVEAVAKVDAPAAARIEAAHAGHVGDTAARSADAEHWGALLGFTVRKVSVNITRHETIEAINDYAAAFSGYGFRALDTMTISARDGSTLLHQLVELRNKIPKGFDVHGVGSSAAVANSPAAAVQEIRALLDAASSRPRFRASLLSWSYAGMLANGLHRVLDFVSATPTMGVDLVQTLLGSVGSADGAAVRLYATRMAKGMPGIVGYKQTDILAKAKYAAVSGGRITPKVTMTGQQVSPFANFWVNSATMLANGLDEISKQGAYWLTVRNRLLMHHEAMAAKGLGPSTPAAIEALVVRDLAILGDNAIGLRYSVFDPRRKMPNHAHIQQLAAGKQAFDNAIIESPYLKVVDDAGEEMALRSVLQQNPQGFSGVIGRVAQKMIEQNGNWAFVHRFIRNTSNMAEMGIEISPIGALWNTGEIVGRLSAGKLVKGADAQALFAQSKSRIVKGFLSADPIQRAQARGTYYMSMAATTGGLFYYLSLSDEDFYDAGPREDHLGGRLMERGVPGVIVARRILYKVAEALRSGARGGDPNMLEVAAVMAWAGAREALDNTSAKPFARSIPRDGDNPSWLKVAMSLIDGIVGQPVAATLSNAAFGLSGPVGAVVKTATGPVLGDTLRPNIDGNEKLLTLDSPKAELTGPRIARWLWDAGGTNRLEQNIDSVADITKPEYAYNAIGEAMKAQPESRTDEDRFIERLLGNMDKQNHSLTVDGESIDMMAERRGKTTLWVEFNKRLRESTLHGRKTLREHLLGMRDGYKDKSKAVTLVQAYTRKVLNDMFRSERLQDRRVAR